MKSDDLKLRTREFALRAIRLVNALPRSMAGNVIAQQFIRSATSVGANYHAACRSKSQADFIAKIGIVLEEIDESQFWIQLVIEAKLLPEKRVQPLFNEARELTAIFTASDKTARKNPSITPKHRTTKTLSSISN